jgi:hypothetical protein
VNERLCRCQSDMCGDDGESNQPKRRRGGRKSQGCPFSGLPESLGMGNVKTPAQAEVVRGILPTRRVETYIPIKGDYRWMFWTL